MHRQDPGPCAVLYHHHHFPSGWYTKAADVEIRIEDVNGTGWQKVEAKIERGGSWTYLTDRNRAKVEITENCTVYVTVTDKDGKAHTKSRYIECFDRTGPTIKAGIDGKLLRVEASDDLSGVDAVFIDGDRYDDLTNGTLAARPLPGVSALPLWNRQALRRYLYERLNDITEKSCTYFKVDTASIHRLSRTCSSQPQN